MKEALNNLNPQQIDFVCKECLLPKEELYSMSEDDLYDKVYETMCDIEVEELCSSNGDDETERCEIASDIVTVLGNALRSDEE